MFLLFTDNCYIRSFVDRQGVAGLSKAVYQDLITGDEFLSDTFPYSEIENGMLLEVEGKGVVEGAIDDWCKLQTHPRRVLMKTKEHPSLDKKQFVTWLKFDTKRKSLLGECSGRGKVKLVDRVHCTVHLFHFTTSIRFCACAPVFLDNARKLRRRKHGRRW